MLLEQESTFMVHEAQVPSARNGACKFGFLSAATGNNIDVRANLNIYYGIYASILWYIIRYYNI